MQSLGATVSNVMGGPRRRLDADELEERIDAAWDELYDALERCDDVDQDAALKAVMDVEEATNGGYARLGFLAYLRSRARRPHLIGQEDTRTFSCRCGDGEGMIRSAISGGMRPCAECNPGGYRLWREGHFRSDHPGCAECRPKRPGQGSRRRRQFAGEPLVEQEPADEGPVEDIADELF